jgi:endonuclease/exonuclease/phosphatase family metal-dependent hydrolase
MRVRPRQLLVAAAALLALLLGGCGPNGLRLETYNIAHLDQGSLSQVAADIRSSNADIVALQETKQTNGQESDAHKLAHLLGWDSDGKRHSWFAGWDDPAQQWCNGTSCTEGNAIISAFPITGYGSTPLYYETGLRRNLIWSDVQIGGAKVRVYATHLAHGAGSNGHSAAEYDKAQLNGALMFIAGNYPQNQPVVLMGDLNLPLDNPTFYGLHAFDALRSAGFSDWKTSRVLEVDPGLGNVCHDSNSRGSIAACTYANPTPSEKLDYIWVRGFKPNAGLVVNNCPGGNCTSDHRPYWTDIGP